MKIDLSEIGREDGRCMEVAQDRVQWRAMALAVLEIGFQYHRFNELIFLFTTASRTSLGPTQPPIQWVPGALSLGVKRPGQEAEHSPLPSAEIKNAWSYTSTTPVRLHGVVLS
jgi:hypothetical protein